MEEADDMKMLTKSDIPPAPKSSGTVLGKGAEDEAEDDGDDMDGACGDAYEALKSGSKASFVAAMKQMLALKE